MSSYKDISKEQLIDLIEDHNSIRKISDLLDCSPTAIRTAMKRYGLSVEPTTNHRYILDHNFFNLMAVPEQETEVKFYWAGYIASSASILKNEYFMIQFDLSEKDREHLKRMSIVLNSNAKIKIKNKKSQNKINQIRLTLYSRIMIDDLEVFGITEKKQFTYKMPDWLLEHPSVRHFLRGWADGRGGFVYHDSNYREFTTSGTLALLEQIKSIFEKKLSIPADHALVSKLVNKDYGRLKYFKTNEVLAIKNYLYENSIHFLDRKKEKLE